jgi:erythromycin esterase-like protein
MAGIQNILTTLRDAAQPFTGAPADYTALLDFIGDARFVLIGEASHGTHDFYHERAEITKRLIRDKGFTAIAVEADWPDAYRINRYVRGESDSETSLDALVGFERFPTWMWRNTVVLDFIGWLRQHNEDTDLARRKRVRPGMAGSNELLFHLVGTPNFLLPLRDQQEALAGLREPRMERAIGVIYKPETERYSHYFYAQLPSQFDAVLLFDETRALVPLERTSHWDEADQQEAPETYPSAL